MTLPRIAESVVRDRLGGAEQVASVDVRALPAVQLLWRRADRLTARVLRYDATGIDVGEELAQTAGIDGVDLRIARVDAGRAVELRDLRLRKEGELVQASAWLEDRRLAAALPAAEPVVALLVRAALASDSRVAVRRVAARSLGDGRVLVSVLARVR